MKRTKLFSLLSPYKWRLLLIILTNVCSVLFGILSLLMVDPLTGILFQGGASKVNFVSSYFLSLLQSIFDISTIQTSLYAIILLIALLYFLKNLFSYLSYWLLAPVRSGVVQKLRGNIYDKILTLPLSFFTSHKKGDIISRAVNDTQEIEFTIMTSIQQMLLEPITVLFYLVTLFALDYQLTFYILLLLPISGLIIGFISKSLRKKSVKAKDLLGRLLSHVEETIQGLRVIKGSNAESFSEEVFQRYNDDHSRTQKRIYRRVNLASPMSEFLGITTVMLVLVIGGIQVLQPNASLTAGLFITFIALFIQIINPAKTISTAYSNYKKGLSTLDRIDEILLADEVIIELPDAISVNTFSDKIEIKNVTFSYTQAEVLKNINLTLKKGEVLALVGQSGSGKSTLTDLLPRFYDVTEGEILLDEVNIKKYVINDLRSLFSIVSQDVIIFNDTIRNNIAFGKKDVSDGAVIAAAKAANAYDFIMAMPDGFQTSLGDRGLNLSGGQRQRISIARAVLRNAPILILDEATSAMDTESEKLVQAALDKVMIDRTTLVVAHRLSTIQHADKIVLLEAGKILEEGTHKELMEQKGRYAKLVEINSYKNNVEE